MTIALGNRIRITREAAGISQVTLAERVGVASATVSRYESGNRNPDVATLRLIAAELGVTVGALVDGGE